MHFRVSCCLLFSITLGKGAYNKPTQNVGARCQSCDLTIKNRSCKNGFLCICLPYKTKKRKGAQCQPYITTKNNYFKIKLYIIKHSSAQRLLVFALPSLLNYASFFHLQKCRIFYFLCHFNTSVIKLQHEVECSDFSQHNILVTITA